jgi:flagellar basal-body rod protein FlgC
MSIGNALTTAVSGLNNAALTYRVAAHNVVNVRTEGFKAQEVRPETQVTGTATVVHSRVVETDRPADYAREAITMIQARISYSANAQVITSLGELSGTLLDIKA